MQIAIRVVVGAVGLLALVLTAMLWLRPDPMAVSLGLAATSDVGIASIRADIAGFFATVALFALGAAFRNVALFTVPVLVLLAAALTGRVIDVLIGGWDPAKLGSMVIEAVLLTIFLVARRNLGTPAR